MPLVRLDDPAPTLGMIRDEASWKLPPGACYDLLNMLNDKQGVTRMRMGSTALVSGAQTAFATSLGFANSGDSTPITELYGANGKTGHLHRINQSTGAATDLGAPAGATPTDTTFGRPANHFGFVAFPGRGSPSGVPESQRSIIAAGSIVSTTFSNTANASIGADQNVVTLTGVDATTNIKVGATVSMIGGGLAYFGRVVSILTAATFSVWPKSPHAVTAGGGNLNTHPWEPFTNAGCTTSFQNRLLWGNVLQATTSPAYQDRQFNYSILPTEIGDDGVGGLYGGAVFTYLNDPAYPPLNFITVPGTDPIVAMEPKDDNELLILTPTHPIVFRGFLTTYPVSQTANPTITWDLSPINEPAGCLSDLSVQRTPRGIVWAGADGVYAFDGRSVTNLTGDDKTKRLASYWRSLAADVTTFVIHGAAFVRNHYIVSGTSGGATFSFACNLANLQWTRLSGVGTDIFNGAVHPVVPSRVFALRWWDQTGVAPSFTNGQTLRLESMLKPYVAGATTTDADGTAITMGITSRTVTGDSELQKMFQRVTIEHQQSSTTAAVTVTAQSKIDAGDVSAASVRALGSLSNTSVLTVSNATNANPIVVTTSTNHGLQSDDFVDIDGVTGNTNANGKWRIVVTGVTTFSLIGGIGNGAFAGSPTCKKITETVFAANPLNAGQGFSLTYAGTPNNFEHHATRMLALQREP